MWMQEPELETFAEARLIVCPARAKGVEQRVAGLAVSLYGLRSARNWGCGDFTDLEAVIDAFAPAGAAFVALNPLHAIANRQPYNTSPYLPQCAFFRNFIYLDVERIGDPHLDDAMRREIEELRASEFVEYERVARLKLAALGRIFEQFLAGRGPAHLEQDEFEAYVQSQGQLLRDYATYCALDEEMHRRDPNVWLWTDWPEEYRDPALGCDRRIRRKTSRAHSVFQVPAMANSDAGRRGARPRAGPRDEHRPVSRSGAGHRSVRRRSVGAAAVLSCRARAWERRRMNSRPAARTGAFLRPIARSIARNGYQLFAQSIRNAAACGGALRIDHVMRFFRLFTIPQGFETSQGTYVQDYAQDLLGILALESVRGNFVVIGEDLGTVTDEVRAALAEAGVLSYRVLWFERDRGGELSPAGELSGARAGVHDHARSADARRLRGGPRSGGAQSRGTGG